MRGAENVMTPEREWVEHKASEPANGRNVIEEGQAPGIIKGEKVYFFPPVTEAKCPKQSTSKEEMFVLDCSFPGIGKLVNNWPHCLGTA